MAKYCHKTHPGLYFVLFAAVQVAIADAQLLCFSGSDYQCNGTLIEDINSVSDCCSLSDAQWYIKDANSSLDCTTCIKITVGIEETHVEVEEDISKLELCVNISNLRNAAETNFSFQLEVSVEGATAMPASDFVPFENYLLGPFDNTVQRRCFEVEIVDDRDTEDQEEFTVSVRQQRNSDLYYPQVTEPDTATIRILDNDYFFGFEQSYYEVVEDEGAVEVCVISKGPPILHPFTITMATVTTSSHQDTDFVSSVLDMKFARNQRKACTHIQIVNDTVAEKPEYFYVFLLPNGDVKISPDLASVKIVDDDGDVFSIERRQYFTSEADDSVEVCVLHDSGELREPVKLTVCTTPGTAINSYDYSSTVSVLIFNSSSPSKQCVSIPVLDDHHPESTKTFSVVIVTEHPSTIIDRGRATVTIRDNDDLPVVDNTACLAEDLELITVQKQSQNAVVQSIQSVLPGFVDDTMNASLADVSNKLYRAISARFNETTTNSGLTKFRQAINEISSGYALACSGPEGVRPTTEDIPKLMREFAAAYEEGNTKLLEIRSIYGQMLCLNDLLSVHEEPVRNRRQNVCPSRENCRCPSGGISEAIICTCEFFDCLDEGDQLKPMFLDFASLSCLAFVVDTTGSMKDEINLATEVIKDFLGSEEGGGCYLLVPFNDDGSGPGSESKIRLSGRGNLIGDHLQLLTTLENSFQPNSGGDCREYSYEAINLALNQELIPDTGIRALQPGSQVIVLTDAPPKGSASARDRARHQIITAATQMKVCMHFFLPSDTFNCLVDYPDGVEEYKNISAETGGVVIESGFVFSEFASTYRDRPCQHVSRDLTARRRKRDVTGEQSCHVFHVSILSHILKLTAKTRQRKVTVTRPGGTMVELDVVDSRGGKDKLALLSEVDPQTGEWKACVEEGSLEISTETRISMDFAALYYVQGNDSSALYLSPSPPPGCTTVRMAVISTKSEVIYSAEIQLIANNGELASSAELDKCGLSWTGNISLPLSGTYSYQVEGQDLYTNPFVYFTQKTVDYASGHEYYTLSYTGEEDIVVDVGELVELKFQLASTNPYGPTTFSLAAERIAGFTYFAEPSEITLLPGQSVNVKAIYLPASSSLEPGSSYTATLTATNGCATLSASNEITIMEEAPPPTLDTNVCGCQNGGTCNVISIGAIQVEVCGCPPGFRGPKCEFSEES